ncbi:MAG TPA: hypothetical protein VGQ20_00525 [Acidimicrobiales bacterium]|jgi:hypothetical protein|nr:hypothetical protein [Acidimicrobiales bacterium]
MDPYTAIARELPNDVRIGGALITMVEPHIGHEHAYNRWYEDDHFYSGAMHGPWTFAGRRWVATRELRARRAAVESSAVQPPDAGCYISLYWITEGHEEDNERWSFVAMAESLMPRGRGFTERTHVYTAFHRYRFGLVRDPGPMKPHLALNAPFAGLLVEVIDAPSESVRHQLEAWLRDEHLPATLPGSPAGVVAVFTPVPFTQGRIEVPGTPPVAPPDGIGTRLCVLWFLDRDPFECVPEAFAAHHQEIARTDFGDLRFSGAFIPTIVGTDRYVDELR